MFGILLTVLVAVTAPAEIRSVRVLATADVQGRVRPSPDFEAPGEPRRLLGGWRGLERVLSREKDDRTLLLDCGNFAAGSAEATATWGRAAVRFMNLVGYDAAALGSRDFTWGVHNLEMAARSADFPMLADPMLDVILNHQVPLFRPWVIRDLRGVRAALIGLSDLPTGLPEATGYAPGSPIEQLRRYLPALTVAEPDMVIAFGSFAASEGAMLADSFPALTLVVCPDDGSGTTHQRLLLVPRYGQRVAVADLLHSVDHGLMKNVHRQVNIAPADSGSWRLERLIEELAVVADDSVGPYLPNELTRLEAAVLLAEACRSVTRADVAILPLETVESGIAAGYSRRHELRSVAPFEDRLMLVTVNDTLLHALARSGGMDNPVPMVAGVGLFVMPGAGPDWPRTSELARLQLAGTGQKWQVVTTARFLARSGLEEPGRPFEKTLSRLWLDYIGGMDTLYRSALPDRFPAGPELTPVEPLIIEPVNINTANAATLTSLPGVGPMTAQRIIEHRETVGTFRSVEDLGLVRGIGPKTLDRLRPLITVR